MKLQTAVKKAVRGTDFWKLQGLLSEQIRWQRKATIARNKLARLRKQIDQMAVTLAAEKNGVKP